MSDTLTERNVLALYKFITTLNIVFMTATLQGQVCLKN